MKGRKKAGVAYRLKGGGNYRAYIPSYSAVLDLGTDNFAQAQAKVESLMKGGAPVQLPKANVPAAEKSTSTATAERADVVGAFSTQPAVPTASPNGSTLDAIDTWMKGQSEPVQEELPLPKDVSGVADTWAPEPSIPVSPVLPGPALTVITGGKKQKGLTPEQLERLSKGLYKIATKVNIVAAEACVRLIGRDPCPLDDDEIELLQMGWEMQLTEWFGKNKPEPWMILLAGNAGILFAMYVRGEPLKKTIKVGDVS